MGVKGVATGSPNQLAHASHLLVDAAGDAAVNAYLCQLVPTNGAGTLGFVAKTPVRHCLNRHDVHGDKHFVLERSFFL
jgi:hypothetical protein